MAKKKENSASSIVNFKNHLIPSAAGGGVAFLLTGVAVLGAAVFAAVWVGNMVNHHLHKRS